jgi:TPR repeat protein
MIEIPDNLAEEAGLEEGQAVKWTVNDRHGLKLVKKTVTDGLSEIEQRVARENARKQHILEVRRRAKLGDVDAQVFLGMIATDGLEATNWFRRAAEQGDRYSMSILGHLLTSGDEMEVNLAEGYFWLLLSTSTYDLKSTKQERAKMGEERRKLQRIAKSLTQEERTRMEDRCHDWLETHKSTKYFKPKI